jgi:hypothetical protein
VVPHNMAMGHRPVTSYYGGGDAIIPMRIDYVIGTAIAVSFDNSSVVVGKKNGKALNPIAIVDR